MDESGVNSGIVQAIQVVALTTESDWRAATPVMRVLRPSLDEENFVSRRESLMCDGYALLGVKVGARMVSIASYTISPHVIYGRELLVHDMATLPDAQGRGHASKLLNELASIAQKQGCGRIFVHTRHAQALYSRNGFSEYSTGMIKKIDG
jgi:ribosomal protein S18 acetylase RimI-like enzyme